MGRPLKIAKAQAVLTITDTTAATGAITVSQNLNNLVILRGMQFVTASSVGGLTGGTTYWVLDIIDANNFTASATSPSVAAPPAVAVSLSDTTSQSVAATVGLVDSGFNNPNGTANTYGVVGGNVAFYGPQVLCNVAFGVAGTGTLFASTSSAIVTGLGTDFANLTTGTTLYALWGDGTGTPMQLGVATSTHGVHTVAVANTNNTGNIIRTTGNAQTLITDSPVTFSANLGGLVTGTTYWVKGVANSSAFTVSTTPGGAEVDLSDATGTPDAQQQQVVLAANSANNATGTTGYGDGFVTALHEAGYILRQKGKTKYLVQGTVTGLVGQALTANVANSALQPNTMNIISTDASSSTAYVASLNDYQSELFPAQVAASSLSAGTTYTIYSSGDTDWSTVGAASNLTGVSFVATASGSGTGTAVLANVNPDVIATFNTAYAANTYDGQPNPIVIINNA
jgi:hypothetical protein